MPQPNFTRPVWLATTRRTTVPRAIAISLAVLLVLTAAAPAAKTPPTSSAKPPAISQEELEKARNERQTVQGELDRIVAAYSAAETQLAKTQAAIKANQTALQEADVTFKIVRNRLSKRADVMYRQGPVLIFHYLLNAENIIDFVRRLTFIEEASTLDAVALAHAVATRTEMTRLQDELARRSGQEQEILTGMSGQTKSLTDSFSKAQILEVKLASDRENGIRFEQGRQAKVAAEAAAKAKADEEAKKKADADKLLASAKASPSPSPKASPSPGASPKASPSPGASPKPSALPSPSPSASAVAGFAIATAGLRCPVAGPVSFTDTWGAPRSGGRAHQGVDMFAASGTPVAAITDGSMRKASSALGGISLYLLGNDGIEYYYAHLLKYADVEQSQKVTAGQTIAYVGASGNASGGTPHVHFEIKPAGGVPINPTASARKACG